MKKEKKEKRREEKEKQRQAEGKDKFRDKDKNGGTTLSELVGRLSRFRKLCPFKGMVNSINRVTGVINWALLHLVIYLFIFNP